MNDVILHSPDRQDFIACIGAARASVWRWAPGIDFVFRQESIGWGVALNIQAAAQRPNLFSDTLKRRFDNIESFDGYYLCLDSQQTFVVWHALCDEHRQDPSLSRLLSGLLALAGLKH